MNQKKQNIKSISLKDVALAAGVSIATVSKALNKGSDYKRISNECIERITKVAEHLGYRPNYHARSLKRKSSKTVGFVSNIPVADGFWGGITHGIQNYLHEKEYNLLLIEGYNDPQKVYFEKGITALHERQIDALIITGYSITPQNLDFLLAVEQPVVIIEYKKKIRHPVVNLDCAPGLKNAAGHLKALGHENILWLGKVNKKELHGYRRIIFKKACQKIGLNLYERLATVQEDIHWNNFADKIDDLTKAVAQALPEKKLPFTAAVCYNEVVALALYRHLSERGIKVPDDFSVIGFDDLYGSHCLPPMTVASHMLKEIGYKAAQLALQTHYKPQTWQEMHYLREEIPSELVIRKSTANLH